MASEKWLIDANELISKVDKSKYNNPHPQGIVSVNHRNEHDHFLKMILDAPIIDAVEVVHGRWVEKPNPWGQDGSHSYDCSICGERTCVVGHKLRYCPNCGAKMDKKES